MKNIVKRKIVLLSPFFYPENISTGKYNTSLVEELVKNNVEIQVICSHPLYPDWKPELSFDKLENVEIIRGGHRVFYPKQVILRRLVLEIWFSFHAMIQIIKIRNEIDTIIAVFPPTLFMILLNPIIPKKVSRIGIIHDLLGVMATSHKSYFRTLISKIIKYGEKAAFKSCDKLICLSESMKDTVNSQYKIAESKLVVQYPFVSIKKELTLNQRLEEIFPKDYKHVVYSGALGEKQIPDTLFKFYEKLCASDKEIMCHIFSGGPVYNKLAANNSTYSNRILFHNLVDEKDLPELYQRSTVQIIPQATGTGAGAFPSKLPNLLAAGVPVFVICDTNSELAKLVNASSIGHVVKNWDMDQWVKEFISYLLLAMKESHEERQIRITDLILEKFSVQSLVKIVLEK